MPLTKKLCIKCHKVNVKCDWTFYCDDKWEKWGWVIWTAMCLGEKDYRERNITGEPPSKCPYLLEHILQKED